MKKIILHDEEYAVLQKLLRAVPVARLTRTIPDCDGVNLRFYRSLQTKVLREDRSFPDTDDGMVRDAAWMYKTPDIHPDISEWDLEPPTEYAED